MQLAYQGVPCCCGTHQEGLSGPVQPGWGRADLRWTREGGCLPPPLCPDYRGGTREGQPDKMEDRGPALAGLGLEESTSGSKI